MFCFERAPTRGRNFYIEERRGGEVTCLQDVDMEKDGKDFFKKIEWQMRRCLEELETKESVGYR